MLRWTLQHVFCQRYGACGKEKGISQQNKRKNQGSSLRNFLGRKVTQRVKTVVDRFPDTIKNYVKECNVGTDAWRRTGMLTFDANRKTKQKVTHIDVSKDISRIHMVKSFPMALGFNYVLLEIAGTDQLRTTEVQLVLQVKELKKALNLDTTLMLTGAVLFMLDST